MPLNSKGRRWRFAQFEFDERSRRLLSNGAAVEIESKPLDVLEQLLLHSGEVVTKEELLDAVWPGLTVVEGSLTTAVSKLRKALADDTAALIVTIPRIGYKLGVPTELQDSASSPPPAAESLQLNPGDPVPSRDQWRLVRPLDRSGSAEVWLGEHPKTHENRVFKFAADGLRLKGLKREVTLARVLRTTLGDRPSFVRILEWNFETAPYFIESEFGGQNLAEWAESAGGLQAIPSDKRLAVLIDVADGVALAHEAGVLHKDLKPANILISSDATVRVADFGAGLIEPARLRDLGITNLGFTNVVEGDSLTGTVTYLAPEVLGGQPPTALADVYALGVILYQLIAADFRKPLAPGWEADVNDPLLRDDIAEAAAGDPSKRLNSARLLADRLRTLEQRRAQHSELQQAQQRAAAAERRLAHARARRPWLIAAALALTAGLAASLYSYRNAIRERDRANLQTEFLAGDLLGRGNPFQSGKSGETLAEALEQAAPNIDRKFANSPDVAARLHHAIARAMDNRSNWPAARREYESAASMYHKAAGPDSPDAIAVGLQRVTMEARTYEKGSLERAKQILQQQEAALARLGRSPRPDLAVWLASARGMVALISNDAKTAADQFGAAWRGAADFDEIDRLTFQQRLAFTYIRLGDGAQAERLFKELADAFRGTSGENNPSVLRVRLNLAQAYMIQGKNKEAVAETTAIYPLYVARLGEEHELTLQVLTTQAQCEGTLGMWTEAIRDGLKVHELAVKKQGPASFFAVSSLADAALAQCRGGHASDGAGNARKAWLKSVEAFGPTSGLTGGTAYALASCEIELDHLPQAIRLLTEIDRKQVAQLAGFPDWGANVDLALAEIAFKQGDLPTARANLALARPIFTKPDAEPYQRQRLEALARRLQ